MPKLLNHLLSDISDRLNNFFATLPPAWLEKASNYAPKSPKTNFHSLITQILNQYWELAPDGALNFDHCYHCHAFRNFFKTLFLLRIIKFTWFSIPLAAVFFMGTTLQRQTTKRSKASMFFCCQFLFLFIFSTIFQKSLQKNSKKNLFVVQLQRRKPYSTWRHKTIRRPPRAKRPPSTDRAEQLTLVRGSRPTPPTSAAAPF